MLKMYKAKIINIAENTRFFEYYVLFEFFGVKA